ncbi:MAG: SemiSWEET transporter [Nitrosomonadales bacterium]|nr:SemiSWEET transporter [Nitrosomonadales bacterium]
MDDLQEWIGGIAATLTTCSFIPQVWRVLQTRHTKDISLGMYALFTCGVALWLAYGILLGAWPIILANGITLLLAGMVLVLKLRFG